jgi:hypothetical protein
MLTPIGHHGPTAISFSHKPPPYPNAAAIAKDRLPGAGQTVVPSLSRPMSAGRS